MKIISWVNYTLEINNENLSIAQLRKLQDIISDDISDYIDELEDEETEEDDDYDNEDIDFELDKAQSLKSLNWY